MLEMSVVVCVPSRLLSDQQMALVHTIRNEANMAVELVLWLSIEDITYIESRTFEVWDVSWVYMATFYWRNAQAGAGEANNHLISHDS